MNDEKPHADETPTGAASALSAGLGGMRPEAWMYKNANTPDWYLRWKKAEDRESVPLYSGSQLVAHSMVAAGAARKEAINRCIEIVEAYRVSVGNSAAGERAAEWTMENLREIRDEMRELVTPSADVTGLAPAKEVNHE